MSVNVVTRNVSLTPEIEAFIIGRIASGRFHSASEVVRAALRLLEEDERRRETRPGRTKEKTTGSGAWRLSAASHSVSRPGR
jgi:putative addiction module CopG family antidote